ncbi:hypothetical protein ACS0TY_023464 [Phlomoides rotata]
MELVWLYLLLVSLALMNDQVHATILTSTIVQTALARGAVCLDGKPPSYSFYKGSGSGHNNWIVYLEGGGWCISKEDCVTRSLKYLGTTYRGVQNVSGIFDDDINLNPDFYNWNKVYVHYCDGSSFMSDIEQVDPVTKLTYRGARIYNVVMEELLAKGLGTADNAMLAGSSAGGLATILHCDMFTTLLPHAKRVKCVSDSGFFIHGKDFIGVELRENNFSHAVVATHELTNSLPCTCTSKINPEWCLFPENLVDNIKTPLFMIESAFDQYQIQHHLAPAVGGYEEWYNCTTNIKLCNATQLGIMKDFRRAFIETVMRLNKSPSRGIFVHSCLRHMHIFTKNGWIDSSGNVLANKTIGEAVGDWYFDRSTFNEIDIQNDSPWNCTST